MATSPAPWKSPTTDAYMQGDNKLALVNGNWVARIHAMFLQNSGESPSSGFVAMMVAVALARELGGTLAV